MSEATLDIDLGNSRVKWRFNGRDGVADHDGREVFQILGVVRVRLASVLNREKTDAFRRRCQVVWPGVIVDQPEVTPACGLLPCYRRPETMGIDRWLGLIALWRKGEPLCVVSAGTALTVDFVDRQGQHLGGYIAPGLELQRDSLGQNTGRVKSQHSALFDAGLGPGKDTQTCVEHALRLSHVGLIKEAVSRFEARHGAVGLLHLAGGNAPWLSGLLERPTQIHKNIVLDGLAKALP